MKSWKNSFLLCLGLLTLVGSNSVKASAPRGSGRPTPQLVQTLNYIMRFLGIPSTGAIVKNVDEFALYDVKHFAGSSAASFLALLGLLNKYFPEKLYKKFKGEKLLMVKKLKALIALLPTLYWLSKAGYSKANKSLAHWRTPSTRTEIPSDLMRLIFHVDGTSSKDINQLEELIPLYMDSFDLISNQCKYGTQWPLSKCMNPVSECIAKVKSVFPAVANTQIHEILKRSFTGMQNNAQSALSALKECDLGQALRTAFMITPELCSNLNAAVGSTNFQLQSFRFNTTGLTFEPNATVYDFVNACIQHYNEDDAADVKLYWRQFCRLTLANALLQYIESGVPEGDIAIQNNYGPTPKQGQVLAQRAEPVSSRRRGDSRALVLPAAQRPTHVQYYGPPLGGQQGGFNPHQGQPTVTLTDGRGEFMTVSFKLAQSFMQQGWSMAPQSSGGHGFAQQSSYPAVRYPESATHQEPRELGWRSVADRVSAMVPWASATVVDLDAPDTGGEQ